MVTWLEMFALKHCNKDWLLPNPVLYDLQHIIRLSELKWKVQCWKYGKLNNWIQAQIVFLVSVPWRMYFLLRAQMLMKPPDQDIPGGCCLIMNNALLLCYCSFSNQQDVNVQLYTDISYFGYSKQTEIVKTEKGTESLQMRMIWKELSRVPIITKTKYTL